MAHRRKLLACLAQWPVAIQGPTCATQVARLLGFRAHTTQGAERPHSEAYSWPTGRKLAAGLFTGSLLLAAYPAGAAQAQAQSVPDGSMPVSETAAHPLEYDPVTNEHTAKMTMARSAALELYQAGKYPQAEAKFLEAVSEARLGFDAKDPHIASTQNNLAEFYRNTGQYDKAEQLYKEALTLLESVFGERHWLYASAMHNLALSYEASGNLEAARQTMEKVMNLRLSMFGARHFLYADSMYALGHILLRQAAQLQQEQAPSPAQPARPRRRWWPFGGARDGNAVASLERRALKLMDDAVQALEDAESVQTTVLLHWLTTLGDLYNQRGRYTEALRCAHKALFHFSNEKGEGNANASELSDRVIELLLETGQGTEARDQAAACALARQQLFGREVAVAQAWLRLAIIESQLGKQADFAAALQHARNAAVLSEELLEEYNKASVTNWLGKQGQANGAKRARVAHVHASSLKFMAEHPLPAGTTAGAGPGPQAAVAALEAAVATLDTAIAAAAQQLHRLAAKAAASEGGGAMDEIAGLYVELQLLLLECLEALAAKLAEADSSGGGGAGVRLKAVRARQEEVSRQLLGS